MKRAKPGTRRSHQRVDRKSRRPAAMKVTAASSPARRNERTTDELRRFCAVMDACADIVCLIDRTTMRCVDMNEAGCRFLGFTRDEILALGPQDVIVGSREDSERAYDRLIARRDTTERTVVRARRRDGTEIAVEMRWRAMLLDGQWIIVGIARRDADHDQTEQALRASEEKYRNILENIEDAYYEVDVKGNLVFFNSALVRLLGYPADELLGLNNRVYQSPDVAARMYRTFNEVYRTGVPARTFDWEMHRRDGSTILVEGSVQLIKDVHGQAGGFRGILRDVTSRREMERALRESEARFRSLIELSSDWYWEMDAHLRFVRMEGKRGEIDALGRSNADVGRRPWETDIQAEGGWDAHRAVLAAHQPFHDFITCRRMPDGSLRYASITGEPMFDAGGAFKGYRGIGCDITKEKIAEQRIQYFATHDGLTNLTNRVMFNELLAIAVQTAQRRASSLAVLFIDLDDFKAINDTLGHEAGDQLLCEVANRLKQVLRGSDVVARFGGDEFVVLIQETVDVESVATVAQKILFSIRKPVALMGRAHEVTASVGVSVYPADAGDAPTLLKHADAAMYVVKEKDKNGFRFYSHGRSRQPAGNR